MWYAQFVEICEKCGSTRNMMQSHVRIKLTFQLRTRLKCLVVWLLRARLKCLVWLLRTQLKSVVVWLLCTQIPTKIHCRSSTESVRQNARDKQWMLQVRLHASNISNVVLSCLWNEINCWLLELRFNCYEWMAWTPSRYALLVRYLENLWTGQVADWTSHGLGQLMVWTCADSTINSFFVFSCVQ